MYYILIYRYTRDSSTYNTRCLYRMLAFTNDLVATKIGVAFILSKCIHMYKRIYTYIHSYDIRYPYRKLAFTNNLVATKIGVA